MRCRPFLPPHATSLHSHTHTYAHTRGTNRGETDDMEATRRATRAMVDVLSKNADPRFENSQFLDFMKRVSDGELTFKDNAVLETGISTKAAAAAAATATAATATAAATATGAEAEAAEEARQAAAVEAASQEFEDSIFQGPMSQTFDTMWKKALDEAAEAHGPEVAEKLKGGDLSQLTQEDWDRMNEAWYQGLSSSMGATALDMGAAAQAQADSGLKSGEAAVPPYVFEEKNPYKDSRNAFAEGMRQFNEGNIREAILAFEADLQLNPEGNSEAWRMLGMAHQENDEDPSAITCLERAVDADPYALPALLGWSLLLLFTWLY